MQSFYSMYQKLSNAACKNNLEGQLQEIKELSDFDPHHLDCLLHPEETTPVWRLMDCNCSEEGKQNCRKLCLFGAIHEDKDGNNAISPDSCTGCGICIDNCKAKNLTDRKDILPVFELLNNSNVPVYAAIAPAFISQFSESITPGKLRAAFKKLGFAGMLEVALFADILTLKEALEFNKSIRTDKDFMLTSCCCPIWIAMIKKIYGDLVPHLPPSVSPMVACGRAIKKLYPDVKVVFIGPCVAKKAEAKEKDIAGAIDYVLTFQEIKDMFDLTEIDPEQMEEDQRDHSSRAGRIYARTGGVSEAVKSTVEKLMPERTIPLKAVHANGAVECKKLLNDLIAGNITANFIEGMGCIGGCVGGPKALIAKDEGTRHVNSYGDSATYDVPSDNPYVIELLHRLGFDLRKYH